MVKMIPCPECKKPLTLYKRTDQYNTLRGFFVECEKCGYSKHLKRSLTTHSAWKAGYYQAWYDSRVKDMRYNILFILFGFMLGSAFSELVYQLLSMIGR